MRQAEEEVWRMMIGGDVLMYTILYKGHNNDIAYLPMKYFKLHTQ